MPDPPPYPTDRDELERVCEVSALRRGGPGGQHQNRRETAVRLHHPPSGLVIVVNEQRSQHQNRELAFERLVEKLEALNHVPRKRRATRVPRGAKEKRLRKKKQRSERKAGRRQPLDE